MDHDPSRDDLQGLMQAALSDVAQTMKLPGLEHPVQIVRDSLGVPHIRATSSHDAFFAQGFVHAQDRLWHMDMDRYRAYGRLAELMGPQALEQDRLWRRMRLGASAEDDFETITPQTAAMMRAYSDGVNAYLSTRPTLPAEYRLLGLAPQPWRPWDGMAAFKGRHVMMGVFDQKLWRATVARAIGAEGLQKLYQVPQHGERLIVPPGAEFDGELGAVLSSADFGYLDVLGPDDGLSGSNNWVVSGERTASGQPLMAGDPHRGAEVPNVYYQNHLTCDDFDVIGMSFPGLPGFPHFGHNPHVAWCITHTGADVQDLFVERFDPRDPARYVFQDGFKYATWLTETLYVRGGEPETLDVVLTHHGPVIIGDPASGHAITMRTTSTAGPYTGFDCFLPMMRAQSAEELEEAVRGWIDPVNNLLFADRKGTIGYRTRGLLPVRHALNAWVPVPGWTGEHEWQGTVPFEEMPVIKNPPQGAIVTANNRVVDSDYPHYIGLEFAADSRARRIQERLNIEEAITPAMMTAIHSDVLSIPATQFLKLLPDLAPRSDLGRRAKAMLAGWSGHMDKDRPEPLIYSLMREDLVRALLQPILGPLYNDALQATNKGGLSLFARLRSRVMRLALEGDTTLLPSGRSFQDLLAESLDRALLEAAGSLGEDLTRWRWGDVHRLQSQHPLSVVLPDAGRQMSPPARPMSGDTDTVQAASFQPPTHFSVTGTSVARYLFDLANWDDSGWVVPLGTSGNAASPHFMDQSEAWQAHELHPMLYSWERIEAAAESRQQLLPPS